MNRAKVMTVLLVALLAGGGLAAATYSYLQNVPVKTVTAPTRTVEAFLFVAIAGGVLAVLVAAARGRLSRTFGRTAALCRRPAATRNIIESPSENNRFAYGPAIAAGCLCAVLW